MKLKLRRILHKVSLLLSLVLVALPVNAEVGDKEFARCAVVKGDLARLECFDVLAKKNHLDGKQLQPIAIKSKGKWQVSTDVNPIDDSKSVTLILTADSGESKWKKKVYLVARCKSNSTELYIGWGSYLGSEAEVLTRIGDFKATTTSWSISTDKKATFRRRPISFLKKMLKSNKMIAQVTPYNENPVTAIFDTSGLVNAIKPLRDTCSW